MGAPTPIGAILTLDPTSTDFRRTNPQVKNPWARRSWTGPYSSHDRARWAPELCAALGYDPEVARKTDDGVFWIDWCVRACMVLTCLL